MISSQDSSAFSFPDAHSGLSHTLTTLLFNELRRNICFVYAVSQSQECLLYRGPADAAVQSWLFHWTALSDSRTAWEAVRCLQLSPRPPSTTMQVCCSRRSLELVQISVTALAYLRLALATLRLPIP